MATNVKLDKPLGKAVFTVETDNDILIAFLIQASAKDFSSKRRTLYDYGAERLSDEPNGRPVEAFTFLVGA